MRGKVLGRKLVAAVLLALLLMTVLTVTFGVQSGGVKLKTLHVPTDYPTMQAAINAADSGDIIQVASGIYYEHVVVNKTVFLVGEDPDTTVIDGNGTGTVVYITADNVTMANFTVQNGIRGIRCEHSNSVVIVNNRVTDNEHGISISFSDHDTVKDNVVTDNLYEGIGAGCSYSTIINNTISNNGESGIRLSFCEHCIIANNKITGNCKSSLPEIYDAGIVVSRSKHNIIVNNTVAGNEECGIQIDPPLWAEPPGLYSSNNTIHHNDFINKPPVRMSHIWAGRNAWDIGYPSGGNYWSNYNDTDLYNGAYQNETGNDGIGDIPYSIRESNTDHYPLMEPYTTELLIGDVDGDGTVNILDIALLAKAFGSSVGQTTYNPKLDLNHDGTINIVDIALAATNFRKTYS